MLDVKRGGDMTYEAELAASWREEIERMKTAIPLWESGRMQAYHNDVDVTGQHVANLLRMIENLEKALVILGSKAGAST